MMDAEELRREARKFYLRDIAEKGGVSQSAVKDFFLGTRNTSRQTFKKIFRGYLLCRKEHREMAEAIESGKIKSAH